MADDRQQSARDLEQLVDWAAGVELEQVPPASLRRAAMILLDDIAAMAAPRAEAELMRFVERAASAEGGEATVFVNGAKAGKGMSALLNGAACCWFQLDEGFRKTSCHAGLYVLPALLAEAEASDLRTEEVLRALLVGYEIVTRVATAWTRQASPHHVHAQFSAVGAAAAVGLARRLPAPVLLAAVAGASTLSPIGPLVQMIEGGLVSNFYAGVGAWAGLAAVDLAQIGAGGLDCSLHDVFGTARGGTFHPGRLCDGLGSEWGVDFGFHKRYAACQRLHAGADAVVSLIPQLPDHERGRRIRRMVVTTHDPQLDGRHPRNGLATRFSFSHSLAAMVVLGHGEATAFGSAALDDPDVAALRERIEILPYAPPRPWPHDRAVRVAITMDDGRTFEEECASARGSPEQPLSDEEVIDKARALTEADWPMLVPTLQRILEDPAGQGRTAWRSVVAQIVTRREP